MAGYGCLTRMHVVRLLAPRLDDEDHTKDIDFSPAGIRSAGRPATPIHARARSAPRGRTSSIRWRASSCTSHKHRAVRRRQGGNEANDTMRR